MELAINNNIYTQALGYAKQQGIDLTATIENFLVNFINSGKVAEKQTIPDVVLSLLGSCKPSNSSDLNERHAYYEYLEEKYK